MKIDKMSLALALVLAFPTIASAQQAFPFTITRDAAGAVTRVDLPMRTSMMSMEEDTLGELKMELKALQSSSIASVDADEIKPSNADDRKVYDQAKAYLKQDLSMSTLEDTPS